MGILYTNSLYVCVCVHLNNRFSKWQFTYHRNTRNVKEWKLWYGDMIVVVCTLMHVSMKPNSVYSNRKLLDSDTFHTFSYAIVYRVFRESIIMSQHSSEENVFGLSNVYMCRCNKNKMKEQGMIYVYEMSKQSVFNNLRMKMDDGHDTIEHGQTKRKRKIQPQLNKCERHGLC